MPAFSSPVSAVRPVGVTIRAYVALTKPRIVELLLATTVPSMVLAAEGWPGLALVAATLVGGSLSAAGANAINQVMERDVDARMRRTSARPLPSGTVPPRHALMFGVGLGAGGFFWLWRLVNLPSALLATSALLFYVLVYTAWLKRSTTQNIVIGGAAGAVPVLVGWTAVNEALSGPAWVLFAVVFFWTPPHFWALALHHVEDYRRAGIPMLPVVRGETATRRQMLVHGVVTVAATLLLVPVAAMGPLYTVTAVVLGGLLLHRIRRIGGGRRRPIETFRFSVVYLTVLFAAVAVDAFVR